VIYEACIAEGPFGVLGGRGCSLMPALFIVRAAVSRVAPAPSGLRYCMNSAALELREKK
jgi:hypothetical protein